VRWATLALEQEPESIAALHYRALAYAQHGARA
jgi:hypothetical protein